jgi:hypothetical protein
MQMANRGPGRQHPCLTPEAIGKPAQTRPEKSETMLTVGVELSDGPYDEGRDLDVLKEVEQEPSKDKGKGSSKIVKHEGWQRVYSGLRDCKEGCSLHIKDIVSACHERHPAGGGEHSAKRRC